MPRSDRDAGRLDRPKQVQVLINGNEHVTVDFPSGPLETLDIDLGKKIRVRILELRFLGRIPGRDKGHLGIAEVAVF